ncbi:hypothetical protein JUN65_00030 [Gluconacetobacter azotocaptans]|uniref:hypothetical protein n=1 Tax=Gluconacetobacter azotocaptans TaxID=142834 RepID=UPI001959EBAE|nr:hypothetical protein [Gluconacetobacter azotocaptans]MBM9399989.1 hypothetical protein [Gluconacetobacter azotocaptans]
MTTLKQSRYISNRLRFIKKLIKGCARMYPVSSIETFKQYYENSRNLSVGQKLTHTGVWSLLITRNKFDSADFARRYFDKFNSISEAQWNLCICAEGKQRNPEGPILWEESDELFRYEESIRKKIEQQTRPLHNMCIAFYNPTTENSNFGRNTLIIPLDSSRIANSRFYEEGFIKTHRCIMNASRKTGVSVYEKVSDDDYDKLISSISSELEKEKITRFCFSSIKYLGSTVFGGWVGSLFP